MGEREAGCKLQGKSCELAAASKGQVGFSLQLEPAYPQPDCVHIPYKSGWSKNAPLFPPRSLRTAMFSRDLTIASYDADLFAAMEQEAQRQEEHIELIASENYTSPAVMEAQGSGLTNKYAEGYPGKRYYGGCEYVDVVEQLAIDRAKATVRRRLRQRPAARRLPGQQRRLPGPAVKPATPSWA